MMNIWITKGEGLLKKVGDRTYSNEDYVNTIEDDNSVIGHYMKSQFPAPVTIKTLNDDVPSSWTVWKSTKIDVDNVINSLDLPPEIPCDERLWISKAGYSKRVRHLMKEAHFTVSPRGIKDIGTPSTIDETLSTIIYSLYYLMEKSTTAFIKNKSKKSVSQSKQASIECSYDIVSNHLDITTIILGSMYVEPSPTLVKRIYLLKAVLGTYATDAIINDIYNKRCGQQIEEIKKLYDFLA